MDYKPPKEVEPKKTKEATIKLSWLYNKHSCQPINVRNLGCEKISIKSCKRKW